MKKKNSTLFPLILVTSLFFLWGFAHNLDPVLIPHLKKSFTLTSVQGTLVDSAVFIAYFLMAIPAGMIMKAFGYKKGIIIGLLIFATGAFLFIPAAVSLVDLGVNVKAIPVVVNLLSTNNLMGYFICCKSR